VPWLQEIESRSGFRYTKPRGHGRPGRADTDALIKAEPSFTADAEEQQERSRHLPGFGNGGGNRLAVPVLKGSGINS
jgi:hypothetical protein